MSETTNYHCLKTIGIVHSCFKEKFGIPRQPGLATEARGTIELLPPFNHAEAVAGLADTSHIWLQFLFHQSPGGEDKLTVRPPRLGGNKRLGVFATRAPVRPNPLGLSVVKLDRIVCEKGVVLEVSGIDVLDGTPVVDIKPYVPYVDRLDNAVNQFAEHAPECLHVTWSSGALAQCVDWQTQYSGNLKMLVQQVLEQDPRPQFHQFDTTRIYGMRLLDFNLRWRYVADDVGHIVIEVVDLQS